MKKATISGPIDEPTAPPTWNSDCAKPWRPPDATRAIRDASGWKIDDPIPIKTAAASSRGKLLATANSTNPTKVRPIASASE